ncbi:MAG: hypothetical protein COA78_06690 [Blastopirellula sp.]|nr:MAG: hypothetical protein COA78_06690 [Blastopirellula sp.]
MGHHISAIISKAPYNEEAAKEYDLPVFVEKGFAIDGLDASHSDYWTEKLNLEYLEERIIVLDSVTTHHFSQALFENQVYAIINTDYLGGKGDQAASVYQEGQIIYSSERERLGPINHALKLIGVKKPLLGDRFTSIGLAKYRWFDDHFEKYEDL